jgi:cellulose synthase/poly-beta-1,6-N-acetylglucosamine synthase-like glycosyltransferase
MEATVIIPYYKDWVGLELILFALDQQTAKGKFDVIITEDDDDRESQLLIKQVSQNLSFPITHLFQEDNGFRKCKALNDAIKIAQTEFLIFIDGDCVPHKNFVEQYLKEKEEGKILYGRRVNLSKELTDKLKATKNLSLLSLSTLIFSGSGRIKEAFYLPFMPSLFKSKRQFWGCNWAIYKKHLLEINGFDEDYNEYGFEDLDIYKRMNNAGFQLKSVKFQCIMYHLYHITRSNPDVVNRMKILYESKMMSTPIKCVNGIVKL